MTTPAQPDPAAQLRAAAQLLQEHIGYLQLLDIRGPFEVHTGPNGYPQEINNVGVPILLANTYTGPEAPPVIANWLALWSPGVGGPLADWLESAARKQEATEQAARANWRGSEDVEARDRWIDKMTEHEALAVARALLGGQP